jgi:hypothetical protein
LVTGGGDEVGEGFGEGDVAGAGLAQPAIMAAQIASTSNTLTDLFNVFLLRYT